MPSLYVKVGYMIYWNIAYCKRINDIIIMKVVCLIL